MIGILEVARVESHISTPLGAHLGCRPMHDRRCLGRAFVVKSVYDLATTQCLIELLRNHGCLRAFCGWECPRDIPSAVTGVPRKTPEGTNTRGKATKHTSIGGAGCFPSPW